MPKSGTNTVNDTGTDNAVYAGKRIIAVIYECIDQCIVIMPGCRMHDHVLWFVYYDYIIIFIDNV